MVLTRTRAPLLSPLGNGCVQTAGDSDARQNGCMWRKRVVVSPYEHRTELRQTMQGGSILGNETDGGYGNYGGEAKLSS